MTKENIVAIATGGLVSSAIGIIRVSGTNIQHIIKAVTHQETLIPRHAYYQKIYAVGDANHSADQNFLSNTVLDIALVIYFQGPNSFTGEDVLEIQAHGNSVLLNNIVESCLKLGCRMAQAGEFSQRAYMNGKLDLVQAESIADLINAQSKAEINAALASLQGRFSQRIKLLNEALIKLRVFVEATLDFPEEDVDFIAGEQVIQQMENISQQMTTLLASVQQGVLLNNGAKIVIVGQPNVGKSSLFNALADEDVAIVTDIAGTTRDVLHRQVVINGVTFNLLDTAGIRESDDVVEQIGVSRAVEAIAMADVCILLIDVCSYNNVGSGFSNVGTGFSEADKALLAKVKEVLPREVPLIIVFNKIDKLATLSQTQLQLSDSKLASTQLAISVKNAIGLDQLKQSLLNAVGYRDIASDDVFIARTRHLDAVRRSQEHVNNALACIGANQLELLAEELRLAHENLCTITGEFSSEDLLGEIFSSFCIGK
jgi:tRNA modification GTPase